MKARGEGGVASNEAGVSPTQRRGSLWHKSKCWGMRERARVAATWLLSSRLARFIPESIRLVCLEGRRSTRAITPPLTPHFPRTGGRSERQPGTRPRNRKYLETSGDTAPSPIALRVLANDRTAMIHCATRTVLENWTLKRLEIEGIVYEYLYTCLFTYCKLILSNLYKLILA